MLSQVARMLPKLWNTSIILPFNPFVWSQFLAPLHAFLKQEPESELQEYSALKNLRVLLVEILISSLRKIPSFWGSHQSNWSWMLISEIGSLFVSWGITHFPDLIFQSSFSALFLQRFFTQFMYFREVSECSSAEIFKERTRKKCEGQGSSVIVLQQSWMKLERNGPKLALLLNMWIK